MAVGETRPRKRQRTTESVSGDADDGKKQRGRPRVEGQDETAADRRRTQIRLAQRAYRLRKETTINTLKEQVASLQGTIEQMNKAFLQFNDEALNSGILQLRPELARLLKTTTEEFILLSKAASQVTGEHQDNEDDGARRDEHQNEPSKVPQSEHNVHWLDDNTRSSSPEKVQPRRKNSDVLPLGYQLVDDGSDSNVTPLADSSPAMDISSMDLTTNPFADMTTSNITTWGAMSVLPNPSYVTFDKSLPPHDYTRTQQFNVEILPPNNPVVLPSSPLKTTQISPQYTYSFQETTFARRLQRASLERGYHLLSQAHLRPAAFNRVFRLSLLYLSREQLMTKVKGALTQNNTAPLDTLNLPFIHLGGAGTHYKTGRIQNGYVIKQGPIQRRARIEPAGGSNNGMGWDVDIDLREYEGIWFDANDVEGYLEEKGVSIHPQSSFTEAQLSISDIPRKVYEISGQDPPSPFSSMSTLTPGSSASGSGSAASSSNTYPSPKTPALPEVSEASLELGTARLFPELSALESTVSSAWDNVATGWLFGSGDKTPDFLSSGWADTPTASEWNMNDTVTTAAFSDWNLNELPASTVVQRPARRTVTIDVNKFIDELIKRGICLGRAPGYRKPDVDRAFEASIIQVF